MALYRHCYLSACEMEVHSRPLKSFDVLVIGGGPAGSTAGSWLGQRGRRVLICEKERFPRFHIGESLLPNGNRILKEIGVWKEIENAGFIKKYGAEFTLPDRSQSVDNIFANGLIKGLEQTYQVERSRFDQILLDHAQKSGCDVRQRNQVGEATISRGGWKVEIRNLDTNQVEWVQTKWIIDASGRNCVMGRTLGFKKESIPYPSRFSVFNHFKGIPRAEGKAGGNIIVLRQKDAWFWVIPISQEVTSVGVVGQKGALREGNETREDYFWRKVSESSFLTDSLRNATTLESFRIESGYCFSYENFGQDCVLLAGDAASFIDPVFSSGVYIALESGLLSAKTVHSQLDLKGSPSSKRLYTNYTRSIKSRIRVVRDLIEAYYDNSCFEVFMTPNPRFKIPAAINSVLAGCTHPPLPVRWRIWLFRKICALHRKRPFVPNVKWDGVTRKTPDFASHQNAKSH